jgi:predicted ATPase/DNA-binding SARP family transcriptional activator
MACGLVWGAGLTWVSPESASYRRRTTVLRLRTFGGLGLTGDSGPLSGAALQPRRLAVLAALAVAGPQSLSRDKLLGLLWPETTDARGRQALSQALYALRRDTNTDDLVLGGEQLRLNPAVISSDIADLEAASAAGDHERVAGLYQGPFLDGIYLSGGDAFERWTESQRVRFAHLAERALEQLAIDADTAGDRDAAVRWWRRLTTLDPLKTQAAVRLISALAAGGKRSEALRYADHYTKLVRQELDAKPSRDVTVLAERLRNEAPSSRFEGRFVIERELGRGGMAVVFLARDLKHDRQVALKMLLPEIGAAVGRERLEREILVTARLQHPNILPLHDSGEVDGTLYYVMPYVTGESLRARLAREPTLPVDDALRLTREVADAIDHAHARGVVHRDIKPENILLADGHAVVADFGIAKALSEAATATGSVTATNTVIGTPAYMAPEQVAGDAAVDGRSDIYSLACVLYEMLAGRPPWIATTTQALLARRFTEEPLSLRVLRPEVTDPIDRAVRRALAPEPDMRFSTASDFAAALVAPATAGMTLPPPSGALFGREQALNAAVALITRSEVRLVTFTGAGGSGKTQLALHVAARAAGHFLDGVGFVDLSPVTDPALLLPAIAHALGVRDQPQRSTLDAIVAQLGARSYLLLLDNFEQVVDAAPVISRLIAGCARLSIAVTSRVRLRVRGEHEFFVAPLAVSDLAAAVAGEAAPGLRSAPAVELFVQRALEGGADLPLDDATLRTIAQICVRLDGLPLAIELAAARVRLLSPTAILARLDHSFDLLTGGGRDLPERHRTLRGAIAASDELLTPRDRRAWGRLAVLSGGGGLDAAAAVMDESETETLDAIGALADASLVRTVRDSSTDTRITMLETIREYALEQLRQRDDERAARDRHRAFFLALAERLSPELTGDTQAGALARLDADWDNLRAALDHAQHTDAAALARLALALWRYWLVRGQWTSGREWLHRAIALADSDVPAPTLADVLNAAGSLAQNQGDYTTAFDSFERALALWRQLGARGGEARTLTSMGWLAWRQCRYADARRLSVEGLSLHRALGDERGAAQALNNLGWIAIFEGDYVDAEHSLTECLAIRRRLGDRRDIAFTLAALGWAVSRQGDASRAQSLIDDALTLFREIGEKQLYAFTVRVAAEMALDANRAADARTMLESTSVPIFHAIGDRWGLAFALGVLGDALMLEQRLEEAGAAYDEAFAISRALDDPYGVASGHARAASLAVARGEPERTAALSAAADELLGEIGGALGPLQRRAYDAALTNARKLLGEARFETLRAESRGVAELLQVNSQKFF